MTEIFKILFQNAIWRTNNNKVLLTIDDSPTNKGTEKILKILLHNNIKALFFVKGIEAKKYSNLIREIHSQGHTIGNHSYSHKSLLFKKNDVIYNEIVKADEIINNILTIETKYFRPPFGRFNFYNQIVDKLDKKTVMWDIFTYDYKNNVKIIKFAVQKCKNNSIITMHDNIKTESNVENNYKFVIDFVYSKGFCFGDPLECLK